MYNIHIERSRQYGKKASKHHDYRETQERILQYAYENHLQGGLSGAIEHIAWQVLKVKKHRIRGQSSIKFDK